jgi:ABC-2 type transport system permease protein
VPVALRLRPATWPWLLFHETRLLWRASGGARITIIIAFLVILVIPIHFLGWALLRRFDLEAMLHARSDLVIWVTAFVMLLVLSSAVGLAVNVLFSRGDMDLLLSSPVPIRNLYAVRGISVGLASIVLLAIFLLPIANMGPVFGRWRMLAAYPVLVAVGLLCAALAFNLTLALARWLGARRARVVAQVLGAFAGASLVLGMQVMNMLPQSTQAAFATWVKSDMKAAWLGPHSVLTWPARAFFGDPLPAVAMLALGLGAFWLTVRFTADRFVSSAQEVATAPSARRPGAHPARRFRGDLARIVIAKELVLIARDPMLIAKSLLQCLYLLPMMLALIRNANAAPVLAATLVVMASSLAGTFAWLTISGEEAPELLESSPVSKDHVRWLKVCAALMPVVAMLLPFLAWYAWLSLEMFAIVAVAAAAAITSTAVIQVWTGKPGSPRDLRARQKQSVAMNLVELFGSLGWAAACYCAIVGYYWSVPVGVIFGLAGPVAAWFMRRWLDRR